MAILTSQNFHKSFVGRHLFLKTKGNDDNFLSALHRKPVVEYVIVNAYMERSFMDMRDHISFDILPVQCYDDGYKGDYSEAKRVALKFDLRNYDPSEIQEVIDRFEEKIEI